MGIESPTHILFFAAVALIVFGPRRLPEIARALGKGVQEFREAMAAGHGLPELSESENRDEVEQGSA